jgi:hypothetical protein
MPRPKATTAESLVADAILNSTHAPQQDKLDQLREAAKKLRDHTLRAADLKDQLEKTESEITKLTKVELPALFEMAGVTSIGIEPEGNMPAYVARAKPYYHANIASSWEPQRREAAFSWLTSNGHGDMIKGIITIEFGLGDHALMQRVENGLLKGGMPYSKEQSVPWSTLTSFVKEQITRNNTIPPLELLGATVGRVVKLENV